MVSKTGFEVRRDSRDDSYYAVNWDAMQYARVVPLNFKPDGTPSGQYAQLTDWLPIEDEEARH